MRVLIVPSINRIIQVVLSVTWKVFFPYTYIIRQIAVNDYFPSFVFLW